MRNMKIGRRIAIIISVVLVIGLVIQITLTNYALRTAITGTAEDRFSELVDARATVVEDYCENLKRFFAGAATIEDMKHLLKDPTNAELQAIAQKDLESYKTANPNMEGLFLMDIESNILCHTVTSAIGGKVWKDETVLKTVLDAVDSSSTHTFSRGIAVSTSTGQLVASFFAGVYDNGKLIGIVGGGCYVKELQDIIYGMELNGLNGCEQYLINAARNMYIFAPDDSLQGEEVTNAVHSAVVSAATNKGSDIYITKGADGKNQFVAYKFLPSLNFVMVVTDAESEILATANNVTSLVLLLGVFILVIMLVVTVIMATNIGKELTKVAKAIEDLGTLDMTRAEELTAFKGRGDEIGMIAKASGELADAVADSVRNLRVHSEELADAASKLIENSDDTVASLDQVDRAVQEIAQGATGQSQETQSATESIVHIGEMVEVTMADAESLKNAAESMRESSGKAREILDRLGDINTQTKKSVDIIYDQTNETNDSAQKIQAATALISSIASQTNLLSLNASIEAARAGDMGKGFAVVAQEIGSLADQSSQSAKEIEDIIQGLVINSKRAVETMDEVKGVIAEQDEYVEKTREIFGDMDNGINASLAGINDISSKIVELDETRNTVVDTVQNLSAIAEENAASTEETSASTSMVNSMMGEVQAIAGKVSDTARFIKENVDVFRI
ncbi:MAG: hypothetical protein K6A74_03810 [Lachnospiraceae bacterium]|nr:hypothetical protein [Lachnospiraceae bacterium]